MLLFSMKIVAQNRKAFHDYTIEEALEAGIMLTGTEVKSLRDGKANLKDSYVIVKGFRSLPPELSYQPLHSRQYHEP